MDNAKIEDLLECPICLEQLNEKSKVLPCQHTICVDCLGIIVESKGHLQCPECRTDYPDLDMNSLPRNVLLVRILEGIRNKRNSSNSNNSSRNSGRRLSAKVKYETLLNQPCARGLYNFNSSEDCDLSFRKGDVVTLVREIDNNWLEGVLKGKRGSIPKNFVEILVPIPDIEDESVTTPFAKALYTYDSKDETEILSFRESDIIGIIKKVDEKWLEGVLGNQYGIFPLNFVKLNAAGKEVLLVESSSSSSEDEADGKRRRSYKCKGSKQLKKQNSTPEACAVAVPCRERCDSQKRNTIHVDHPLEQSEDGMPENCNDITAMTRTRSVSASAVTRRTVDQCEPRPLANTAIINNAIRTSNEHVSQQSSASNSHQSISLSTAPPRNNPESPLPTGNVYTALFTYSPSQDDELALIQGDQYCVVEKHLDGWYRGFHMRSRQTGVFPGNYVKPSSQVTSQMLRPTNSIGYSSNPASPTTIGGTQGAFVFPTHPRDTTSELLSTSPQRNGGVSGILKILKKSKSKRSRETPAQTPCVNTTSGTTPPQYPPSYYHSSMPGPNHVVCSRPMPLVPVEPPPPYTPTVNHVAPITSESSQITSSMLEKFRAIATYPANHDSELSFRCGDVIYVMKKRLDGWYKGKCERTGSVGIFPSTFVEPSL